MAKSASPSPSKVRCAIYTRKSSEEGLEQDFNSLHAQREACEAYILSQAGEGWVPLPAIYDDGGYSGGNIERPALQRLLADIDRGAVDTVVVYKIDRLTRSLMDFSKIVDRFDAQGASFVSVTQSFNTTTSMGRLTLNVLLSFAQFEREVTGERIRDKLAASKKKGMWMGGIAPLGYEASGRTLVIVEQEAALVRHIFARYLQLKSAHELCRELRDQGCRSKRRKSQSGIESGGHPIRRGALFYMLSNLIYRGQIVHKSDAYPGQHPAIIDTETFEAVQLRLASNRHAHKKQTRTRAAASPLKGKLFCVNGERMVPSKAYGRADRTYRYYVALGLQTGDTSSAAGEIRRLSGPQTDAFVIEQLERLVGGPASSQSDLLARLARVDVDETSITLSVSANGQGPALVHGVSDRLADGEQAWLTQDGMLQILLPVRLKMRGGRSWRRAPDTQPAMRRSKPNRALIAGLQRSHGLLKSLNASPLQSLEAVMEGRALSDSYKRRLGSVGFLAPDIQEAILEGRQPPGLTLQALLDMDIPKDWEAQRRLLNFGSGRGT